MNRPFDTNAGRTGPGLLCPGPFSYRIEYEASRDGDTPSRFFDHGCRLAGAGSGRLQRTARCVTRLLPSPAARFVAEGDRLSAERRSAEAILAYRQAVAQDARHVPALRKLARAYAAQGRRRQAQQYLRKAALLQPGDAGVAADLEELVPPEPTGDLSNWCGRRWPAAAHRPESQLKMARSMSPMKMAS